jgi:hypothetical protein
MKVKLIKQHGQAAIVEYQNEIGIQRVVVPMGTIVNGEVDDAMLEAGIPYGEPWSSAIQVHTTPETIETELHRRGIWTIEDARADPLKVREAALAAFGRDIQQLLRYVNRRIE